MIAELAKHNDTKLIANLIQSSGKSVTLKASKIPDKSILTSRVNAYIQNLTKSYSPKQIQCLQAERFAVETAKDHFKDAYDVLYDASHGINGPDLILKNKTTGEFLIVECKGAMSTTNNPALYGGSLNKNTLGPQLSQAWLSGNNKRYINYVKDKLSPDDFTTYTKIYLVRRKNDAACNILSSGEEIL